MNLPFSSCFLDPKTNMSSVISVHSFFCTCGRTLLCENQHIWLEILSLLAHFLVFRVLGTCRVLGSHMTTAWPAGWVATTSKCFCSPISFSYTLCWSHPCTCFFCHLCVNCVKRNPQQTLCVIFLVPFPLLPCNFQCVRVLGTSWATVLCVLWATWADLHPGCVLGSDFSENSGVSCLFWLFNIANSKGIFKKNFFVLQFCFSFLSPPLFLRPGRVPVRPGRHPFLRSSPNIFFFCRKMKSQFQFPVKLAHLSKNSEIVCVFAKYFWTNSFFLCIPPLLPLYF